MSQVDYLHFFNNIVWNLIQLLILYGIISVFYVQNFYKILRLRLLNFKSLCDSLKGRKTLINTWFNKFKKFGIYIKQIIKFYKLIKKNSKNII